MKNKRQLINMDIEEVSLVDKGANKKKFLLIKREDEITELLIKTDGTVDGTTLSVNSEEVKDLKSFWFSLWPADDFDDGMMSGTYTSSEADGAEFDRETTFHLKKGMKTMKLEELLKILKVDPETVDQESANHLGTLLKFVDMMPPENATFALNLIKAALTKEETPAEDPESDGTPAETDDMPPEKVAEIRSAMAQLNGMLPEDQRVVIKAEEPDKLDLILAGIAAIGKTDKPEVAETDDDTDAPNSVAAIMKRLIVVEQTTGVSDEEDDGIEEDEELILYANMTKEEKLKKYGTVYARTQAGMGFSLQKYIEGK